MPAAPAAANEPILLREDREAIATLTLNRPAQYNAFSDEMLSDLQAELESIADDQNIRVVVMAARGKAFSAGHDLKQMRGNPNQRYYEKLFKRCSRATPPHKRPTHSPRFEAVGRRLPPSYTA